MHRYTIRSTQDGGMEEIATTDSLKLALLLCEQLEACHWYTVELEDHDAVIWATYIRWQPAAFPNAYASLSDIPRPD